MKPEPEFSDKRGLSIKALILCIAVAGVVVSVLTVVLRQNSKQSHAEVEACLTTLGYYNKALTLYRADYDEYSPVFEKTHDDLVARLSKYSDGKTLRCPTALTRGGIFNYQARVVRPTVASYKAFYGIQEESVLLVCPLHFNIRMTILWNGIKPRLGQEQNKSNPGFDNVLLRNGSAKSIPANSPRFPYLYDKGVFTRERYVPGAKPSPGQRADIFVFEPGPPRLER